MFKSEKYLAFIKANKDIPHNNKHHNETFAQHIGNVVTTVIELAEKNNDSKHELRVLVLAALLHDIGKVPTVKIRNGNATFYGHEIMSTGMMDEFLTRDDPDFEVVKKLVMYHMLPYNDTFNCENFKKSFIDMEGSWFWSMLRVLNAADTSSVAEHMHADIIAMFEHGDPIEVSWIGGLD